MKVFLITLSMLVGIFLQTTPASADPSTYQLLRVIDGDTFVLTDTVSDKLKVRLGCVDAPEVNHRKAAPTDSTLIDHFAWGDKSKKAVLGWLSNQNLTLEKLTVDRYGRTVAQVHFADGGNLAEKLVDAGLAQVYEQYTKDCTNAPLLRQLQQQAQVDKKGIWSDPNYLSPSAARAKVKAD